MGLKSKRKGRLAEREIVRLAWQHGLPTKRTWQTAQATDLVIRACDLEIEGQPYQVQIDSKGFTRMYRELKGVQGFFFRADRREWLVVLRAQDYLLLLEKWSIK